MQRPQQKSGPSGAFVETLGQGRSIFLTPSSSRSVQPEWTLGKCYPISVKAPSVSESVASFCQLTREPDGQVLLLPGSFRALLGEERLGPVETHFKGA